MFLDIQMPMVDGFEVVSSTPHNRLPAIIFTTAYDQYAIKAFEVHAIDYLLKPFTDERLYESLNRAKELIRQKKQEEQADKLKKIAVSIENRDGDNETTLIEYEPTSEFSKILIKEKGKVHFIDFTDIIWIEAFDYYVKIHIKDRFYMLRESMRKLIGRLPNSTFARIHNSSIVNLSYIKTVDLLGNGEYKVHLSSGLELKVSRGYKESVKHLIKN
jgi:two-component system LytT family response regulator